MERTSAIIAAAEDAADMRRRMGAAALEMDAASDDSVQERWRATVAARLPSQHWPERTVLITAVDAHTGEPVVFDRHSGVDLADAIAASCSSGTPYEIGDNRVSAGWLYQIARALGVEPGYFFEGLGAGRPAEPRQRMMLELARSFVALPSRRHQEVLCELARALNEG